MPEFSILKLCLDFLRCHVGGASRKHTQEDDSGNEKKIKDDTEPICARTFLDWAIATLGWGTLIKIPPVLFHKFWLWFQIVYDAVIEIKTIHFILNPSEGAFLFKKGEGAGLRVFCFYNNSLPIPFKCKKCETLGTHLSVGNKWQKSQTLEKHSWPHLDMVGQCSNLDTKPAESIFNLNDKIVMEAIKENDYKTAESLFDELEHLIEVKPERLRNSIMAATRKFTFIICRSVLTIVHACSNSKTSLTKNIRLWRMCQSNGEGCYQLRTHPRLYPQSRRKCRLQHRIY